MIFSKMTNEAKTLSAKMTAGLHSTISTTINHFLAYCESQNIDVKGVSGSIVVGLCAGVSIVVVLVFYPGEHKLIITSYPQCRCRVVIVMAICLTTTVTINLLLLITRTTTGNIRRTR